MNHSARAGCCYNSQREVNTPLIITGVTAYALATLHTTSLSESKVTRHNMAYNVNTTSSFVTFRYVQVLGASQQKTSCFGVNTCGRECTEVWKPLCDIVDLDMFKRVRNLSKQRHLQEIRPL